MSKEANQDTAPTIRNVYQAIAAVQGELATQGIAKNNKNKEQGYQFRGIDDVYNALAPLLSKYQLCILPEVESREEKKETSSSNKVLFHVIVRSRFTFVSATDGSKHQVVTYGQAMDSADKATNKAMSAAYKYACLQTFCIPTEGDNDADATTHEVKAKVSSVFESSEALELYVANCVDALTKADSIDRIKDLRDLEAAKRQALKSSECEADRDAYNRIVAAQQAMVEKLKPKTVEAAKQSPELPADVAADPIPY